MINSNLIKSLQSDPATKKRVQIISPSPPAIKFLAANQNTTFAQHSRLQQNSLDDFSEPRYPLIAVHMILGNVTISFEQNIPDCSISSVFFDDDRVPVSSDGKQKWQI